MGCGSVRAGVGAALAACVLDHAAPAAEFGMATLGQTAK
jgi:hypothetical protein